MRMTRLIVLTAAILVVPALGSAEPIGQLNKRPFRFTIDSAVALNNQDVSLGIRLDKQPGRGLIRSMELLVCFDAEALWFNSATVGESILKHNWEYWTYRIEMASPGMGTVRIRAIAETNFGQPHPDHANPTGVVAWLNFHTSNDRTKSCTTSAVRFCWEDCDDNTAFSWNQREQFVAGGSVVDYDGTQLYGVTPDPFGYNATVVDSGCVTATYAVRPAVEFYNGSVRVICPGEIDDRCFGDLNMNGLGYEIADAVLFLNYLVYGPGVLDPVYYAFQALCSDAKYDGTLWGVDDFVYFIRIITGDAEPEPIGLDTSYAGTVDMIARQYESKVAMHRRSDHRIGAALLVFDYESTEITSVVPGYDASNMDVDYNAKDGELRVLIYNIGTELIPSGTGDILTISKTVGGSVHLRSVEAATYLADRLLWTGAPTSVADLVKPGSFTLHPNHPNPFNPSTTLSADFPAASHYTMTIYNIAGQAVRHFAGTASAGRLEINWDGKDRSGRPAGSGVYFYRLKAGDHDAVRKMVLMK